MLQESLFADAEFLSIKHAAPIVRMAASNHIISDDPDYDGDEWYTPPGHIESARVVMGSIDLDPASCEEAQSIVNAGTYYTKDVNALRSDCKWFGNVWLNPPYSMPAISKFVHKLIWQYEFGNVSQAIILTNNSSETEWFQCLITKYPACFKRGRVKFWRPNGNKLGARQGQTFFYLGPNFNKFRAEFSKIGTVVTSH